MQLDFPSGVTILGMALVTFATRAGGLWLLGFVTPSPRIATWLRHIPGTVLMAIVAPAALTSGPSEVVATMATALIMASTGRVLLAASAGVGVVWVLRHLL